MQIRKTYKDINPELLYDELKDFIQKQGVAVDEARLETYSLPGGSAHVVRATLAFSVSIGPDNIKKQCVRAHIVGSAVGETKLMLDVDEAIFALNKVTAVQEDLDFIFGSYEVKPR